MPGAVSRQALRTAGVVRQPRLEVSSHPHSRQQCVRVLSDVAAGETLSPFTAAAAHALPSRLTVQVSESCHIELAPAELQFVNHSCEPNGYFDVETSELVALRPIAAGEEVVHFYPSTEWKMSSPFECHCGSPGCLGWVSGAADLPSNLLRTFRLAPHVRALLDQLEAGRSIE